MSNSIRSFLNLLGHKEAGGVTEVAIFNAKNKPQFIGYFDDYDRAANEIARFDGRNNIFASVNPVKRDLLARAENRLVRCTKRITDADILWDSWFFVDIDPERASGTSATQDELDAALWVQGQVDAWLVQTGVPRHSSVTAVSGNGAYILIRLPDYLITPETKAIKQRFLHYIAERFSTETVKIDKQVCNLSRLICVLGTLKTKGEHTEERPHRRSYIERVAGEIFDPLQEQKVTPFDLYDHAKAILPGTVQEKPVAPQSYGPSGFNMLDHTHLLEAYKLASDKQATAKCPVHNGKGDTSLSISLKDGAYHCWKGCTAEQIRAAIGFPKPARSAGSTENEPDDLPVRAASWPAPLTSDALHGLAGDVVSTIAPRSESDPAALLLQFLVTFGNVIARSSHFIVEATEHYLNLFVVLVGPSSKGRKGTSWEQVRRLFKAVDPDWELRVQSGLSSGEGLIWAVRDKFTRSEPVKEKGRIVDYQEVIVDSGVQDKRLLVYQSEFASTLRVMERDGNTLSPIVREAWDGGPLQTMTKNSDTRSTGAHISIIGHVTASELRRYLGSTEAGNGFANRFLWPCVRRSQLLPEGGRLHEVDFAPLTRRLGEAIAFARTVGEMRRDDEARQLWWAVYESLSEGKPGILGSVTSRGEAQVMRLACIYALLDMSAIIRFSHLKAALAVWRYCEDSARFIFGDSLGDPEADEILRNLRESKDGMTRTEINNLFGRNRTANQIGRALGVLIEAGLVHCVREATDSPGRPAQRFVARQPAPLKPLDEDDAEIPSSISFLSSLESDQHPPL